MARELHPSQQHNTRYHFGEPIGAEGVMRRQLHHPLGSQYKSERVQTGGLSVLMSEMGEYELLQADEEVHFARTYHAGEEAQKILETPSLTIPHEDRERLEGIAREGLQAKEVMICANLRLVVSIANKFRYVHGGHHEMEVLVGEGIIGLNRAVEKYRPELGYKFSTYASWWIKQHMQRASNMSRTIHIPSHVLDSVGRIERTRKKLRVDLGREPDIKEVSSQVELPVDKINELERLARLETTSLDADFHNSEDFSLIDVVEDDTVQREFRERETDIEMELIEKVARDVISDVRGWEILKLRFGINETKEPQTLEAIGEKLGLTRERVRQIQKQAEVQLKQALSRRGFSRVADFS